MIDVFTHDGFSHVGAGEITHGFFGRGGGVSIGIYNSLNCGAGSNDDPDAVAQNRAIVAAHLGHAGAPLSTLWQIHSDICIPVDAPLRQDSSDPPKADAMVTDRPGVIIGALSADCGPVLFCGKKTNGAPIIGAAHAGWGGALKGILESTVQTMLRGGLDPKTLAACLGPCLHQNSYEVQGNFIPPFVAQNPRSIRFFKSVVTHKDRFMFDLPGYILARLSAMGIRNIAAIPHDTYGEESLFFSYRRATHRGEQDYGRQVSAIVINR